MTYSARQFLPDRRDSGFTLIEILVVIVIITLMLGIAVPVLRVLTGGRSEEGATNMIVAMLGRARTDALGLQKITGVMFVFNPNTHVEQMAEVVFPTVSSWSNTTVYNNGSAVIYNGLYYLSQTNNNIGSTPGVGAGWSQVPGPPLDIQPQTDVQSLPTGVGVQTVCNTTFSGGKRQSDGYLSVGVILFDGLGRLTAKPYAVSSSSNLAKATGLTTNYPSISGVGAPVVPSQFGLVVFQADTFLNQNFSLSDPAYSYTQAQQYNAYTDTSNGPSQQQAEDWLDQNSTPLLIDRYTGTLIRGG